MNWQKIELGQAFQIKHGYAFKSQFFAESGDYIVLTPGNFYEEGGFRLRPGKDRFYTGDFPEDFILNEGDLIIAMTEQAEGLLGSSAIIPTSGCYLHNQRLGLITELDEDVLDLKFLYYLFNTSPVRHQISASASGTKVRHTAPKRIYRVKASMPGVREQRKIASILSAYDDLIENNRRRIQLLEQAARLLYKEWFVYLRFPGHEHVKSIDGVPEGWEKKSFSELANFVNGYPFKPVDLGEEGLPIVKIPELRDGVSDKTPRNIGDMIPEKFHIDSGDILFSWSGTLLANIWADGHAILNQHLFKVESINKYSKYYVFISLLNSIDAFMNETTGSTMRHIRRSALDKVQILKPWESLLHEFHNSVEPIYQQVLTLKAQIMRLKQARDLMLPRLMNGEIAVTALSEP